MMLAILQARMSSSRLPGKVLEPILGTPLILRAIERISRAESLDAVVLATSLDPTDDPLVRVAEGAGVTVRRGSLNDVLGRYVDVVREFQPDTVVRLTGDNPLADPAVIDLVVSAHLESGADYSSNTITRTFPRGLDVEVVDAAALTEVDRLTRDPDDREHVTMGVYRRPERFRLHEVTQSDDNSDLRWTVDLPEDLAFVREVYQRLHPVDPLFGQRQILELLRREPGLRRTERDAGVG